MPRVADWIDQALLISYVGTNISVFRQRGIRGAIDLAQLYSDACGNSELATSEDAEARRARAVKLMDDLARDTKLTAESMMSIGRSLFEDSMVNLVWNLWNIHSSSTEPVKVQLDNDAATT